MPRVNVPAGWARLNALHHLMTVRAAYSHPTVGAEVAVFGDNVTICALHPSLPRCRYIFVSNVQASLTIGQHVFSRVVTRVYWDLFPLSAETSQHNRGKRSQAWKVQEIALHIIEHARKPRRGTMFLPAVAWSTSDPWRLPPTRLDRRAIRTSTC